jgi:hypothetical protein
MASFWSTARPPQRRVRAGFGLLVGVALGLAALVPGCRKNPIVTFRIGVPSALENEITWYEMAAFAGTDCNTALPQIQGGVPLSGAQVRVAFRKDDPNPPEIGDLRRDRYAFVALAKGADCTVVASGCTNSDVNDDRAVVVNLAPNDQALGKCPTGSVCEAAQCLPPLDNRDPAVGAGCSMQLLGAGPFANPLGPGVLVSSPAVAPTEGGFLIGYREVDPEEGRARRIIVPLDRSGGSVRPLVEQLSGRCSGSEEDDSAGLATNGKGGLFALGRRPCQGVGGLDYYALKGTGEVQGYNFLGDKDAVPILSKAHSIVAQAGDDTFLMAVTERSRAVIFPVLSAITDPRTTQNQTAQFHCGTSTEAYISRSDQVLAMASVGPAGGGSGGGDAGADAAVPSPTEGSVVRVSLLAAGTAPNPQWCKGATPPVAYELPGSWASLASVGKRTVVITEAGSASRPVAYSLFDLDKPLEPRTEGFSLDGNEPVLFADVALQGNRMFVVAERANAISIVVFDNVATTPTKKREVSLAKDSRIPSLLGVRDGRIAIAATDSRVAVAWTTATKLERNDAAGGYAVFACTP